MNQTHLGGRAEDGPEEAGRGRAEGGEVGDAPPRGALVVNGLVGGDHGPDQLKAAVVAAVLRQGQGVVLVWGRQRHM